MPCPISPCSINRFRELIFAALSQRSPTFLAPGTGVMRGNFCTDGGGGSGGAGDGSGGNTSDGEQQMTLRSLARRSAPCTGTGPWPGAWGPPPSVIPSDPIQSFPGCSPAENGSLASCSWVSQAASSDRPPGVIGQLT